MDTLFIVGLLSVTLFKTLMLSQLWKSMFVPNVNNSTETDTFVLKVIQVDSSHNNEKFTPSLQLQGQYQPQGPMVNCQ